MFSNTVLQIKTYFRNLTLNAIGVERDIYERMNDGDVNSVISMMEEHDLDVDNALSEYNPQLHDVMHRADKWVKGEGKYRTEKLPRTRQKYINEVELFFLLGNPILWKKVDGDDDAFEVFKKYLSSIYFNTKIRQCKRLAGAETESAFIFNFSQRDGKMHVDAYVAARSEGYKLRELFDQYGNMVALAVGYNIKQSDRVVECWDILTQKVNYHCEQGGIGWRTFRSPNPTGKINGVYFRQPKAWDGAEPRMSREEHLDSKIADTNNYFADPIAAATADVINSLPRRNKVGKLIQLTGKDSKFEYINPPQNSEIRKAEKEDLKQSILFDTFTPDMSPELMKSLGTLTSVGIKRALVLGYIKRANRMEIYEELIGRLSHVIIAVLKELYPDMASKFDKLEVGFDFAEPFDDDKKEKWTTIATLYQQGVMSLELAVQMLALTDAPAEEIERIKSNAAEKAALAASAKDNNQS
nr:MAG TPA: portal protein [Caudoviricetes sp.]